MAVRSFRGSTEPIFSQHPESQAIKLDVPVSIVDGSSVPATLTIEPNVEPGQKFPLPQPFAPDTWGQSPTRVLLKRNDTQEVVFHDEGGTVIARYAVAGTGDRGRQIEGLSGGGTLAGDKRYAIEGGMESGDFVIRVHDSDLPAPRGSLNVMAAIKA